MCAHENEITKSDESRIHQEKCRLDGWFALERELIQTQERFVALSVSDITVTS